MALRWIQHAVRKRKKLLIRNTAALVVSHGYESAWIRARLMLNDLTMPASGRDRLIFVTYRTCDDSASSGHFVPDFLSPFHYTLIEISILCAIAQYPRSDLRSVKEEVVAATLPLLFQVL